MTDPGLDHRGWSAAPAHAETAFASRSSSTFGREVSYFDAVYGFAATLLIANVDAPPADAWRNMDALLASGAGAQLLGFALSFTVIAVMWRVNVRLTRRLTGLDGPTTAVNLAAAASVVLIAFTTQGISDPGSEEFPLATAVYAANIALAALLQTAMFQIGRARGLERVPSSRRHNLLDAAGAIVTPLIFVVSIPIALTWGATAGKWTWATAIVLGPLVGALTARASRNGG